MASFNCCTCVETFEDRQGQIKHNASLMHHLILAQKTKGKHKHLCPICKVTCFSLKNYIQHCKGSKHLSKCKKKDWDVIEIDCEIPVGEEPKVKKKKIRCKKKNSDAKAKKPKTTTNAKNRKSRKACLDSNLLDTMKKQQMPLGNVGENQISQEDLNQQNMYNSQNYFNYINFMHQYPGMNPYAPSSGQYHHNQISPPHQFAFNFNQAGMYESSTFWHQPPAENNARSNLENKESTSLNGPLSVINVTDKTSIETPQENSASQKTENIFRSDAPSASSNVTKEDIHMKGLQARLKSMATYGKMPTPAQIKQVCSIASDSIKATVIPKKITARSVSLSALGERDTTTQSLREWFDNVTDIWPNMNSINKQSISNLVNFPCCQKDKAKFKRLIRDYSMSRKGPSLLGVKPKNSDSSADENAEKKSDSMEDIVLEAISMLPNNVLHSLVLALDCDKTNQNVGERPSTSAAVPTHRIYSDTMPSYDNLTSSIAKFSESAKRKTQNDFNPTLAKRSCLGDPRLSDYTYFTPKSSPHVKNSMVSPQIHQSSPQSTKNGEMKSSDCTKTQSSSKIGVLPLDLPSPKTQSLEVKIAETPKKKVALPNVSPRNPEIFETHCKKRKNSNAEEWNQEKQINSALANKNSKSDQKGKKSVDAVVDSSSSTKADAISKQMSKESKIVDYSDIPQVSKAVPFYPFSKKPKEKMTVDGVKPKDSKDVPSNHISKKPKELLETQILKDVPSNKNAKKSKEKKSVDSSEFPKEVFSRQNSKSKERKPAHQNDIPHVSKDASTEKKSSPKENFDSGEVSQNSKDSSKSKTKKPRWRSRKNADLNIASETPTDSSNDKKYDSKEKEIPSGQPQISSRNKVVESNSNKEELLTNAEESERNELSNKKKQKSKSRNDMSHDLTEQSKDKKRSQKKVTKQTSKDDSDKSNASKNNKEKTVSPDLEDIIMPSLFQTEKVMHRDGKTISLRLSPSSPLHKTLCNVLESDEFSSTQNATIEVSNRKIKHTSKKSRGRKNELSSSELQEPPEQKASRKNQTSGKNRRVSNIFRSDEIINTESDDSLPSLDYFGPEKSRRKKKAKSTQPPDQYSDSRKRESGFPKTIKAEPRDNDSSSSNDGFSINSIISLFAKGQVGAVSDFNDPFIDAIRSVDADTLEQASSYGKTSRGENRVPTKHSKKRRQISEETGISVEAAQTTDQVLLNELNIPEEAAPVSDQIPANIPDFSVEDAFHIKEEPTEFVVNADTLNNFTPSLQSPPPVQNFAPPSQTPPPIQVASVSGGLFHHSENTSTFDNPINPPEHTLASGNLVNLSENLTSGIPADSTDGVYDFFNLPNLVRELADLNTQDEQLNDDLGIAEHEIFHLQELLNNWKSQKNELRQKQATLRTKRDMITKALEDLSKVPNSSVPERATCNSSGAATNSTYDPNENAANNLAPMPDTSKPKRPFSSIPLSEILDMPEAAAGISGNIPEMPFLPIGTDSLPPTRRNSMETVKERIIPKKENVEVIDLEPEDDVFIKLEQESPEKRFPSGIENSPANVDHVLPNFGPINAHSSAVTCIEVFDGYLYTCSSDLTAKRFSLSDSSDLVEYNDHSKNVTAIRVSKVLGQARVFTSCNDGYFRSFNAMTGEFLYKVHVGCSITCMTKGWDKLFLGLQNGMVFAIPSSTSEVLYKIECASSSISEIATTSQGAQRLLCVIAYDGIVTVWDTSTRLLLRCMEIRVKPPSYIQITDSSIFVSSMEKALIIQNISSGELLQMLNLPFAATGLAVVPRYIIYCSYGGEIRCYNRARTFTLHSVYYGAGKNAITCMTVHQGWIFTGNRKGEVEVVKFDPNIIFPCQLGFCNSKFGRKEDLLHHFSIEHVPNVDAAVKVCQWRSCNFNFSEDCPIKEKLIHLRLHYTAES